MNVNRYITAINLILLAVMFGLLFFGNYILFILAYIAVFLFATIRTLLIQSKNRIKVYFIIAYGLILSIQIVVVIQIIFAGQYTELQYYFRKLFGLILMLLPLLINRFISVGKYAQFYLPSIQELATISFAEVSQSSEKIVNAINDIEHIGKSLSSENVKSIIEDLPRHDSFHYINDGSLTEAYFREAAKTLAEPFIYIVISNTGSAASEMISVFTQTQYNHASMSFDQDLKTIISYNGGDKVYPPGLNPEMLKYFRQKPDASILIYKLACTLGQKKALFEKIKDINDEGSAYNMMGLVLKYSHKPNIMFCSQFVFKMLQQVGLDYFEKKDSEVRPTDLIELDYRRKLKFVREIKLNTK